MGSRYSASRGSSSTRPRIEKVRLLLEGGPETIWSEYEQLTAEIEPLLEGTPLTELTEDGERNDVMLLAGKTGQPPARIAALIVAHKLAKRTGIAPEVFYGLARQDQPTSLATCWRKVGTCSAGR